MAQFYIVFGFGEFAGFGIALVNLNYIVILAGNKQVFSVGSDFEHTGMLAGFLVSGLLQSTVGIDFENSHSVIFKSDTRIKIFAIGADFHLGTAACPRIACLYNRF